MSLDPHDVRMAAGAGAAILLEALDDEAIELMARADEAVQPLVAHLRDQGLEPRQILVILVGCAMSMVVE